MKISRRNLLKAGLVAAVITAAPAFAVAEQGLRSDGEYIIVTDVWLRQQAANRLPTKNVGITDTARAMQALMFKIRLNSPEKKLRLELLTTKPTGIGPIYIADEIVRVDPVTGERSWIKDRFGRHSIAI
ncbi:hypothetical protein EVB91_242 [Rhizobium phage RHph_I1_18]|nr:hypothetical protein EVB91_242 [Rhizobium phage RHph_I1_18]